MGQKRLPTPPAMIMIWISLKLCIKLFLLPLSLLKGDIFSKIIPSFFTIKGGFFLPLRLSCKESSTFSPSPSSSGSGDVTALWCSEPLRSKVGGPSKVYAMLCGMGPPGEKTKYLERQVFNGK